MALNGTTSRREDSPNVSFQVLRIEEQITKTQYTQHQWHDITCFKKQNAQLLWAFHFSKHTPFADEKFHPVKVTSKYTTEFLVVLHDLPKKI
jgi:hypothetical protein